MSNYRTISRKMAETIVLLTKQKSERIVGNRVVWPLPFAYMDLILKEKYRELLK